MHPAQVLDLKADLMVRSQDSTWIRALTIQIEEELLGSITGYYDPPRLTTPTETRRTGPRAERAKRVAHSFARMTHDLVQEADAYYVSPEMTDLIAWASIGLDDTDRVRFDEIPTKTGFAYFEKPLEVMDIRGRKMLLNGVLWFPSTYDNGEPCVCVMLFNDHVSTPDDIALELRRQGLSGPAGRWGMIGMQLLTEEMRIGPSTQPADQGTIDKLLAQQVQPHEYTNVIRLLHTYWMLLNQTVTKVSQSEIPRTFGRRARRKEIPDRVTVVALRRIEGHSHGETDVDWQYRWMVRGHWRWQHVSKEHPLAEPDGEGGYRARVWVRPHVKGPEDKPFHLTDKVYALVR